MFGVSVLALAAPAYAADPAMQPEPAADWSGFYAGFNLGYGMGNTSLSAYNVIFDGTGSEGASGGVFAGYNHQFDNDWVAGFEFGGVLSDVRGHTELEEGSDWAHLETKTDWSVGAMARLGKLVSPDTLIFAGVGAKVFHGEINYEASNSAPQSEDDMFTAMGTVTVGIETALGSNWRLRAQYDSDLMQYNSYEDVLRVRPLVGSVRGSLIYAFGEEQPAPQVTSDADKWTGFYAGVVGGQSLGVSALEISDTDDMFRYDGFGSAGWTGGLVAGANMRAADRLVLGAEVGLYGSSLDTYIGAASGPKQGIDAVNDSWIEGRVRAGYLASDSTMLYGFAGVSRIDSKIGLVSDGDFVVEGDKISRTAATAGVGIETWVGDNITFRGEYEYATLEPLDFGNNGPDQVSELQQNQQTATVGVFYHFGN
jgi:outer membrane immunogenic protein